MIEIKQQGTGSWLDPLSVKGLSARLSNRLTERCRGHRGLFVTLTYDRTGDTYDGGGFDSSLACYRAAQDEQHVPLFLRKVSRYLGESLTGRWICKLEFQKGGWPHFHIIMLDVPKIPHEELKLMWNKGHVDVRRMSPKNIRYCTKYAAKGGDLPAWLLAERSRAVKIIRVSPGFWKRDDDEDAGRRGSRSETPDRDFDEDPQTDAGTIDYDPDAPTRIAGMYKPIGQKLDEAHARHTGRIIARDEDSNYNHATADFATVLLCLYSMGCRVISNVHGWTQIDATFAQLDAAIDAANTLHRGVATSGYAAAPPAPAAAAGRGLHLIQPSNPDTAPPYNLADHLSPWMNRWFDWHARQEVAA